MVSPGVLSNAPSVPSETRIPRRYRSAILKLAPSSDSQREEGARAPDDLAARLENRGFFRLVQNIRMDDNRVLVEDAQLVQVRQLAPAGHAAVNLGLLGNVPGV